jgi:hypothetical protein
MTTDPPAREWIRTVATAKKQADDYVQPYFGRFVTGKEVPTKQDVANPVKILNEALRLNKLIYSDLMEMEGAMHGWGGANETWFRNDEAMLHAF